MKKLLACFIMTLSLSSFSFASVVLNGADAEKIFNDLENLFEYKSGASVSGLVIETIVRHDDGLISCSKETVQFGDQRPVVTFECILK